MNVTSLHLIQKHLKWDGCQCILVNVDLSDNLGPVHAMSERGKKKNWHGKSFHAHYTREFELVFVENLGMATTESQKRFLSTRPPV